MTDGTLNTSGNNTLTNGTFTMSGGNFTLQGGFWGVIAAVQTPEAPIEKQERWLRAVIRRSGDDRQGAAAR